MSITNLLGDAKVVKHTNGGSPSLSEITLRYSHNPFTHNKIIAEIDCSECHQIIKEEFYLPVTHMGVRQEHKAFTCGCGHIDNVVIEYR